METAFENLIAQLRNPQSADAQNAAGMLSIASTRLPIVIETRMSNTLNFFDSIMSISRNARNPEAQFEREFAAQQWVPPDLWIKFVAKLGNDLKQQQQAQLQQHQLQQQQLQQQQQQQLQQKKKMELTPEQHAQLQQQTHLMHENWERIRQKLTNCEDPDTNMLSSSLNISCDIFRQILIHRGQAFTNSLFDETLNVGEETSVAANYSVDPVKWIDVIKFLRVSLRNPYQQPVASHENQNDSRALEPSPVPRMARPTPLAIAGRGGHDIDASHNSDFAPIKAHIHAIINDGTTYAPYENMISEVLGKENQPITHDEYEQIFGGAYSAKLIPAHNILVESFKSRFHDPLINVDEAFQFACRAYLHAIRANPIILSQLESSEPKPKRLYVIARLMRHFITKKFDRNEGMHLGGKKSRSKKRGLHRRKSIHRRKKSSHKKRK